MKIKSVNKSANKSCKRFCLVLYIVTGFLHCCLAEDIVYRGKHTNDISSASIIIPSKVSSTGDHLTHHLTSHHDEGQVYFNITIDGKIHMLELYPSWDFMSPGLVIERRRLGSIQKYRPTKTLTKCHFEGFIRDRIGSKVALSACDGLVGLVETSEDKYLIEPLHNSLSDKSLEHKHLLYKRSAVYPSKQIKKKKKKKKKESKNCGTKEPKKFTRLEWQKEIGKVEVQEKKHKRKHSTGGDTKKSKKGKHRFGSKRRKRRSVSKPQFVEALLVADASMVEFHEDGDIEMYLLTIMNMVSSLYTDPSIGNLVKIVVVKILLIDGYQSEPDLNVTSSADGTLKAFCKWQKTLNPESDSNPHHHDVAILVTRKDICGKGNRTCNTLGVAHVGGMCKSEKSCSVNEDNGITLAHTIAHEMGHNLGMYHDTDKTGCENLQGHTQHIMTPSFQADTVGVSWSDCSRKAITNFLDKGLGECLQDRPKDMDEYEYPELPPGAMYDANYQCRLQFGEHASTCSPNDEICSRLWCTVNNTCTTLLIPAAPGTHCGKHKWCQDQKCISIMEPPISIDGAWGEWGAWSECSRSCGAGVSISERDCDHPKPASGGAYCVGTRRRYKMCNTDPCPAGSPSFRTIQCSRYNNQSYEGKKYEWVSYFEQEESCQLYCTDANETIIVPWGDYAEDGTPCNVGARDVCISGICKKVGCDWVVESKAREDECGICQGDGTKCDIVKGVYSKQSGSPGYREVVVVPAGARNIYVAEKDFSENYIGISSALHNTFYLNGKRQITLPGEYLIAGSLGLYERNPRERVKIPGPIKEPIVVLVIFTGKVYNPGIIYRYSLWKPEKTMQVQYQWSLGEWSQCSATCGGGTQVKNPQCREVVVSSMEYVLPGQSSLVDPNNCEPSEMPEKVMRACNDDACPSHWWIGPWQSCPVTCVSKGEKPKRRRSVMCVDGQEMALPDHFCDRAKKPLEYQGCKLLPECPLE